MTHLFAQGSTSQPKTAGGASLAAQVEVAAEKFEAADSTTAGLEALAELENLARLGSSVATLIAAEAYVTGRHAERNGERALALLEPFLELEDPSASALAGKVWDDGWTSSSGYQQSTSKAVSYYRAVLEAKPDVNVTSRLGTIELLGKRNTNGDGSDWPPNPKVAIPLLEQAARQGHAESQFLLGFAAERGLGQALDAEKARGIFEELARNKHRAAVISLERMRQNAQLISWLQNLNYVDLLYASEPDMATYPRKLDWAAPIFTAVTGQEIAILDSEGNRRFQSYVPKGESIRLSGDGDERLLLEASFTSDHLGTLTLPTGDHELFAPDAMNSAPNHAGWPYLSEVDLLANPPKLIQSSRDNGSWIMETSSGSNDCALFFTANFFKSHFSQNCSFLRFFDFFAEDRDTEVFQPGSENFFFYLPEESVTSRIRSGTMFSYRNGAAEFSWTVPDGVVLITHIDPSGVGAPDTWRLVTDLPGTYPPEIDHLWEPGGYPVLFDGDTAIGWLTERYAPKKQDQGDTAAIFYAMRAAAQISRDFEALDRLYSAYLFNQAVQRGLHNSEAAGILLELGRVQLQLGHHKAAIEYTERSLEISSDLFGYHSEFQIAGLIALSQIYQAQDDLNLANAVLNRAFAQNLSTAVNTITAEDGAFDPQADMAKILPHLWGDLLFERAKLSYSNENYEDATMFLAEFTARELLHETDGDNVSAFVEQITLLSDALYFSGETEVAEDVARRVFGYARTDAGVALHGEPLPRPFPVPQVDTGSIEFDLRSMLAPGAENLARVYFQLNRFDDAENAMRFATEVALEKSAIGSERVVSLTRALTFYSLLEGVEEKDLLASLATALGWELSDAGERPIPPILSKATQRQTLDLWLSMLRNLHEAGDIDTLTILREYAKLFVAYDRIDALQAISYASQARASATGKSAVLDRLAEWRGLAGELETIDRRLAISAEFEQVSERKRAIETELRQKRETILDAVQIAEKFLQAAIYGESGPAASVDEITAIQSMLTDGETVVLALPLHFGVNFLIVENSSIYFHFSHVHRFAFDKILKSYQSEVSWPKDTRSIRSNGHRLNTEPLLKFREIVFDNISDLVEGKRLILVPYGSLRNVPFEAIPLGEVPEKTYDHREIDQLRFLGLEQQITYMPSLQVLKNRLEKRALPTTQGGKVRFVGFGDPIIGQPTLRQEIASITDWLLRSETGSEPLATLPATSSEIRDLRALFDGRKEDVYLRDTATLGNFRNSSAIGSTEVLAFATHAIAAGLSNGQVFDEPFLLLSSISPSATGVPDEAKLNMSEVLSLELQAKLVMLSACSTASSDGTFAASGMSGLVRAFMIAGAQSVLASLWDVESRSSYYLTTYFAEEMTENDASVGQALLNAKKRVFNNPSYRHPRFWSAFILIGDPELEL